MAPVVEEPDAKENDSWCKVSVRANAEEIKGINQPLDVADDIVSFKNSSMKAKSFMNKNVVAGIDLR